MKLPQIKTEGPWAPGPEQMVVKTAPVWGSSLGTLTAKPPAMDNDNTLVELAVCALAVGPLLLRALTTGLGAGE